MIQLVIKQDHAPVSAVRIIDQHIRPILLIEAAIFHLAVKRIAHLAEAVSVFDPALASPFDARACHKRQRLAVLQDRLAHVKNFTHFSMLLSSVQMIGVSG